MRTVNLGFADQTVVGASDTGPKRRDLPLLQCTLNVWLSRKQFPKRLTRLPIFPKRHDFFEEEVSPNPILETTFRVMGNLVFLSGYPNGKLKGKPVTRRNPVRPRRRSAALSHLGLIWGFSGKRAHAWCSGP